MDHRKSTLFKALEQSPLLKFTELSSTPEKAQSNKQGQ